MAAAELGLVQRINVISLWEDDSIVGADEEISNRYVLGESIGIRAAPLRPSFF